MNWRDRLQQFFELVYFLLLLTFFWLIGTLLGLGIFSLIPSSRAAFDLIREVKNRRHRQGLKFFHLWWDFYKTALSEDWWVSAAFIGLGFVLVNNYLYFSTGSNLLAYFMYYVTLFLLFFLVLTTLWYAYIRANYRTMDRGEAVRNALLFPGAALLESIILVVSLVAVVLILVELSPALFLFIGMGILLLIVDFFFGKISDGQLILRHFKNWWKTRE